MDRQGIFMQKAAKEDASQRTTPAGKRGRKKAENKKNNFPPPNNWRIFCEYFGRPARTQATERIL